MHRGEVCGHLRRSARAVKKPQKLPFKRAVAVVRGYIDDLNDEAGLPGHVLLADAEVGAQLGPVQAFGQHAG